MRDRLVLFRNLPRRVVQVQYRGDPFDRPQTDEELLEEAFKLDDEAEREAERNSTKAFELDNEAKRKIKLSRHHVKEFFLDLFHTHRRNLEYAEQLIAKRPEWTHELKPIVYEVFDDDDGTASVASDVDLDSFPTCVK